MIDGKKQYEYFSNLFSHCLSNDYELLWTLLTTGERKVLVWDAFRDCENHVMTGFFAIDNSDGFYLANTSKEKFLSVCAGCKWKFIDPVKIIKKEV